MANDLKVLTVFGTRPEAVKMAPVIKKLEKTPGITLEVCVTAQHRQMLDQVLDVFEINPDYDLDLMKEDQSLAQITANVITQLDHVIQASEPDWLLAQGDTTTVMAASILSYYHRVKFGHIEAGLRTSTKWLPFPEEINRRVTSVIADLHFAPTQLARQNLLNEGIPQQQVYVTGNPVIDALHAILLQEAGKRTAEILQAAGIENSQPPMSPQDRFYASPRLVLVTAHRRESFGSGLVSIFEAVKELAEHYQNQVQFIYPVHLNPNVQAPAREILDGLPNVHLIEPLDYRTFAHLMNFACLVLTDSGGLQEEAPALGIPVLVMRNETERPEGIQAGTAQLVGTSKESIVEHTQALLEDAGQYYQLANAVNPYGDGKASERIVEALLNTG
jgi:UDP-N-acetylglucosamine 2-epimerase (non-hydrolysing)